MCWGQSTTPPKIIAQGDQAYCPQSQIKIITDFDIIDPDETEIRDLYIQISKGYKRGEDILYIPNMVDHPNIIIPPKWSSSEGKLTLESTRKGKDAQLDLIAAVKDVVFENSNVNVSGEKLFSFTIGSANYLPSTGHYYEYIPNKGITWNQAKLAAQNLDFYGLQGYLATITTYDEAQLSGEQAAGTGWIGGSDAAVEGEWKWVTGPEAGTLFYRGVYPTGNTITYSFWNGSEPNNLGDEDYAHVTDPSIGIKGSWNDLAVTGSTNPDSPYHPQGFIVEYGGMSGDPVVDISAFTRIYVPALKQVGNGSSCGPGEVNLTAELDEISPSSEIHWFESEISNTPVFIGESFLTSTLTSTTSYYVLASENGCSNGSRTEVTASIHDIPQISPLVVLKNCDEDGTPDGFVDFNLTEADEYISLVDNELTITYYSSLVDAENKQDALNHSPYNNSSGNVIYGRAENLDGCYKVATVKLEVSTTYFPPDFDQELVECDNDDTIDGLTTGFDLTKASDSFIALLPPDQNLTVQYYRNISDAQLEENEILPQNSYKNEIPFSQTIYVRVESKDNGDCFGIGSHLVLNVNPRPDFEVIPTEIVCINLPPITLVTFNATDNFTYEWTNEGGDIISTESVATVSAGGLYTVIATSSSNCQSFPKTVLVDESVIAIITEDDVTIVDDSENNTITIDNSGDNLGIGNYEFALNDRTFQDESFFDHVEPGIHTIFVRDKNNCGIAQLDVAVIGYPKFFTPNNDSINDTWQVRGISENFYATSLIYIFNQFGKVIAEVDPIGNGWDGYYNGKLQPNSDYWFSVKLIDKNGNTKEKQGHFSLISE